MEGAVNDTPIRRWHIFPDKDELLSTLRSQLLREASKAIEKKGRFNIVLAGGETPVALYHTLIDAETDWQAWHIYFGDERCLPQGDPQRNDQMAKAAWLNNVPIPPDQIHSIPAELGAEEGAKQYSERSNKVEMFDLILLGLGEDGHTASLFPNAETTYISDNTLAIANAPKPPAKRVSLSAKRLAQTAKLFFIVTGGNKRNAIERWRNDEPIPASMIKPNAGVDVYLDYLAAGR